MTTRDPREELREFEPVEPSVELRRRVLASVDPASRWEGFVARFARLFDLDEARAREVLASADPATRPGWTTIPLPGVQLFHFAGGPGRATADCGLVHLAPGAFIPRHRHTGTEWNFVLSGSADDESGTQWLPGDLVLRETDSVHILRNAGAEPLLFAVVLEAPIEVLGLDGAG
jgi:anti-sigma factor ChrR (cupin superfamily)